MMTILIYCSDFLKMKYIKSMYGFVQKYHSKDFPKVPDYSNFIRHGQRMIPVCKNIRADSHKVARELADFRKNWQGRHFGFKLHGSVNVKGQFCEIHFTPASFHDAQL